jgi:hypothetical protein
MPPRKNSVPFQLPIVNGFVVDAGAQPEPEDATCEPLTYSLAVVPSYVPTT